jgi:hypothetical protein
VLAGCTKNEACDAVLVDLDGDGHEEILLFDKTPSTVNVFREDPGVGWHAAATLILPQGNCAGVLDALRTGHFKVSPPSKPWNDIEIEGVHMPVRGEDSSKPTCPASH